MDSSEDGDDNTSRDLSEDESMRSTLSELLQPFAIISFSGTSAEDREKHDHEVHQATLNMFNAVIAERALQAKEQDEPALEEFCRICRESESKELFTSPCDCKGTLAKVHLTCLERWLAESDTTICELCGHLYDTVRTPRMNVVFSFMSWLKNTSPRETAFDVVTFLAITPLVVMCSYMGVFVSDSYYNDMSNSLITRSFTLALVSTIAAVDTAYLGWLFIRCQHHFLKWYSYWRRDSVVKIVLPHDKMVEDKKGDKLDVKCEVEKYKL